MGMRRTIGALVTAAGLACGGVVVTAAPAAAKHVSCNDHIMESVTFDGNVTNCRSGLHVMADNITIDLAGFTLSGRNHPGEMQYGIHLMGVTNVTVTSSRPGAVVTGFDAGVVLDGGSENTVSNLIVRDNVNDLLGKESCEVGDGILLLESDDNSIVGNSVLRNGPYSGMAMVRDSDRNLVSNNFVADNNIPNARQGSDKTGPCGSPFSRRIQDIGIRIEGPGAVDNVVAGNEVVNSAIVGISVHGYICNPPPELGIAPEVSNSGTQILDNVVRGTGAATFAQDPLADGIAVLSQGPAAIVCTSDETTISGNTSFGNMRDGINLNRSTQNNVASNNTVYDNGRHGLVLSAGTVSGGVVYPGAVNNTVSSNTGFGNGTNPAITGAKYDGADFNPDCDNNSWSGNVFGTFNQACVMAP